MAALNFKIQFAQLVRTGVKNQTIRAKRVYPIKKGEKLFLYTGMRTKKCEKLRDVCAKEVIEIKILSNGVYVDGLPLHDYQILDLAKTDGFNSSEEFIRFFETFHGLPFEGHIIRW